jgi:hypothetical protein
MKHTYDVKMIVCMEVGGRRYGQPKTAAMAIANKIAMRISDRWWRKQWKTSSRDWNEEHRLYRILQRKLTKIAYRRIKARVEKAFKDYVIA